MSTAIVTPEIVVPFSPSMEMIDGVFAWEQRGITLAQQVRQTCWDIGDWIVDGQDKHHVSDVLDRAEKLFGKERGTLETYASVARVFPASIRIEDLTFGHHRAVLAAVVAGDSQATAEKRQVLLRRAVLEELSVRRLRNVIDPPVEPADDASITSPSTQNARTFTLPGMSVTDSARLAKLAKVRGTKPQVLATTIIVEYLDRFADEIAHAEQPASTAVIPTAIEPATAGWWLTFESGELKQALKQLGLMIDKHGIPEYHHVRLFKTDSNTCLAAISRDGTLTLPIKATGSGSPDVLLDYNDLVAVAENAAGNITLSEGESGVRLTAGDFITELKTCERQNFMWNPPVCSDNGFTVDLATFKEQLERVKFAIPETSGRFTSSVALAECDGTILRLVATDGKRMAISDERTTAEPFTMCITDKAIPFIKRLIGEKITLGISDEGRPFFVTDAGQRLIHSQCPMTPQTFPNYKSVLKAVESYQQLEIIVPDAERLASALRRTPKLGFHPSVALSVRENGQILTLGCDLTFNEKNRQSFDSVAANVHGPAWTSWLARDFLLPFLERVTGPLVIRACPESKHVVDFRACNDKYRYVVMPMRPPHAAESQTEATVTVQAA